MDNDIDITLKQLVTSGDLPCTKDDAATLAAVHLQIDNSWPEADNEESCQIISIFPDGNKSFPFLSNKMVNSRLTSSRMRSRRPFRLIPQLSCVSDKEHDRKKRDLKRMLAKYIPPEYHDSKKTHELIKEKYKKLWHTPFFESEIKLKQLYMKLCKNLPAYGCQIFQVREILRGNIHHHVQRLLGVSSSNIVLLDHKSKVLIRTQAVQDFKNWHLSHNSTAFELEFRGSKPWMLNCSSENSMRSLSSSLWEVLDCDGSKSNKQAFRRNSLEFDLQNKFISLRSDMENGMVYAAELEELNTLIHYPEEVALMLIQNELKLFQSIQPQSFVRYVTTDLTKMSHIDKGVWNMITRLKEVSSWITHLIITQPTHEERKNIFSCILRLAIISYGIGNFNAVVEILAGLKSENLKPFWLTISDTCKADLDILDVLSADLLSKEPNDTYRLSVSNGLKINNCSVIPFFGTFLSQLKAITNKTPTILTLPSSDGASLSCIADFNGEDKYFSRIGVGGLINMNKVKEILTILNDISMFQNHNKEVSNIDMINNFEDSDNSFSNDSHKDPYFDEFCNYEHNSIIHMVNITDVTVIQPRLSNIDPHCLQIMHLGTTIVKHDKDPQKCVSVYFRLSMNNSLLIWTKPAFRTSQIIINKESSTTNVPNKKENPLFSFSDYSETKSPFHILQQNRYNVPGSFFCTDSTNIGSSTQNASNNLDSSSGFIDVLTIKQLYYGNGRQLSNISSIMRKFGYKENDPLPDHCCISIIYGCTISENKIIHLIFPTLSAKYWLIGMTKLVEAAKSIRQNIDQKLIWLKHEYLRLFYMKEMGQALTLAEITKTFGGRRWSISNNSTVISDPSCSSSSFTSSVNIKARQKRTSKTKKSDQLQFFNFLSKNTSSGNLEYQEVKLHNSTSPSRRLSQDQIIRPLSNINQQTPVNVPSYLRHPTFYSFAISPSERQRSPRAMSVDYGKKFPANYDYLEKSPSIHSNKDLIAKHNEYMQSKKVTSDEDITRKSYLNFTDFCHLFRSFMIYSRIDIKQIFDRVSVKKSEIEMKQAPVIGRKLHREMPHENKQFLLTRNYRSSITFSNKQKHVCAAVAVASIVNNGSSFENSNKRVLPLIEIKNIINQYQDQNIENEDCWKIIEMHEPDFDLRSKGLLSFEGFVCYIMDKKNFLTGHLDDPKEQTMDHPLSHYFVASSHNTYLSGHQITGESSIEMYAQVLLNGCRCIELDCWDGEDGSPVIYHGHTFTNKISFQSVIEVIDRSAFKTSPYPVILSIENHCSLIQQQKMSQIFKQIFGEKLVTKYLFDSDFEDDPYLPSPNQLKYKILIKNKKLTYKKSNFQIKAKVSNLKSSSTNITNDSGLVSEDIGNLEDDEDEDDDEYETATIATTKDPLEMDGKIISVKDSTLSHLNVEFERRHERSSSLIIIRNNTNECSASSGEQQDTLGIQDWQFDDIISSPSVCTTSTTNTPTIKTSTKIKSNKASQIDPGLSELVVYTQAVKLRSLNLKSSPQNHQKSKKGTIKRPMLSQAHLSGSNLSAIISHNTSTSSGLNIKSDPQSQLKVLNSSPPNVSSNLGFINQQKRQCDIIPSSHQIASLNENKAKSICRRIPMLIINHCEKQLIRTYPAGIRLDSSNFNPVIFWAFGIQLVALNYQTEDQAFEINQAMFAQTNFCGYVLKPKVMWDKNHVLFNKFNPWEKEFEGIKTCYLTLQIISGQNLSTTNISGSPLVELEIIGIQQDCTKSKTKSISRNMVNPNWSETFHFEITFPDLAFIKFAVIDVNSGHTICHKIYSFKTLKRGFRHIPLIPISGNQLFDIATLFVLITIDDEVPRNENDFTQSSQDTGSLSSLPLSHPLTSLDIHIPKAATIRRKNLIGSKTWKGQDVRDTSGRKSKMKFQYIFLCGVSENENYTILKVSSTSTGYEVISQALHKSGESDDNIDNYVLLQEPNSIEEIPILVGLNENISNLIETTNNNGRFMLKKKNNDPSSRAWMTTIINEDTRRREGECSSIDQKFGSLTTPRILNFLVCIYNVSPDQPYTILKADINSTVSEIIALSLAKARSKYDPNDFILVEEVVAPNYQESPGGTSRKKNGKGCCKKILDVNDCVYHIQKQSNATGKLLLIKKSNIEEFLSSSSEKKGTWNFLSKSNKDTEIQIRSKDSTNTPSTVDPEPEHEPSTSCVILPDDEEDINDDIIIVDDESKRSTISYL